MSISSETRNAFPYLAIAACLAALAYALSFGSLGTADFTFVNETELQSIDPALVTGQPEGRVINALFEGLYREDPKTLEAISAIAKRHDLSDDQKTYTFHLRSGCRWSNGEPITAHDFHWSWRRFLHPETAAQYAYQLYYVKNAKQYNTALVEPGDRVEVELDDRPPHPSGQRQLFPRGTVRRGKLIAIKKPPVPQLADDISDDERAKAEAPWRKRWVYHVDLDGREHRFAKGDIQGATKCLHVLLDFSEVGVRVLDDHTLRAELENPTPYFPQLMAFYPLHLVNRACVEQYGAPAWTKAANIVTNGPYQLEFRRIRDRIRLVKNPHYWNADRVQIDTIDALAINSRLTALNMYLNGQVDWITVVPDSVVPIFKDRQDYSSEPYLTTYFYRINVTRDPCQDKLVRQALNAAIDKREICEAIMRAGQVPARSFVPPGMIGYESALCGQYDVDEARLLLTQAGFPGGRGLPTIEILFNTDESHRTIAEKIQNDWKKHLGIDVELKNQEWGVFIDAQRNLDYGICRAGWGADYADPNTFLDLFVTGGENNETGWGNRRYDELIQLAQSQIDPKERMRTLREAERILMDEQPIIPIYFYVSRNLVRPYVKGFFANSRDTHPLLNLSIDEDEKTIFFGK